MTHTLTIKNIDQEELDQTIDCIHSASIKNKEDYPHDFIDQLNKNHYTKNWLQNKIESSSFFVGKVNGKVVATGSYYENKIVNIFVSHEYQGYGIGRDMMRHLLNLLENKGYNKIKLNANLSSVKFYQKLGFQIEEEIVEKIKNWEIKSFKMIKYFEN